MTSARSTALNDIVTHLLGQGHPWVQIGAGRLRDLVVEHTPHPTGQGQMWGYLCTTTSFATSGDVHMPTKSQRFLHRVRALGWSVTVPRCPACGNERVVRHERRLCDSCNGKRHLSQCDGCGRERTISVSRDGVRLCNTCRRRQPDAKKPCATCGNVRLPHTRIADGWLCSVCAPGKTERCVHCHQQRRVRVRFTAGPTCEGCFNVIRNTHRPCPSCGQVSLVAAVTNDGRLACSECAGRPSSFVCIDCGIEDIRHGKRCFPCAATVAVDTLFSAGTQARRELLAPLRDRLVNHPSPKAMVHWPTRSASAGILLDMLTETSDVSHAALDALTGQAASLLRCTLVDLEILPARQEHWESFDRWLDSFLDGMPDLILRDLAPFCRWAVPARVRISLARRGVTDSTFARARRGCRTAHLFLTFLTDQGADLATGSQTLVEDFLAMHPKEAEPLRVFLRWAIESKRARRMTRLASPVVAPSTAYSTDEYRSWMDRFATDDTLPVRARITGLLCGALGRPTSAIAKLTRGDVDDTGEHMTARFGRTPVQLRHPLPDLIRAQLAAPRRWDIESQWLFPAKLRAGAHADYSCFTRDLNSLGCNIVALRGAALLALAGAMAVGPLVDLTGMSVNAAARWQETAAAAYSRYPGLRS